ncbi:carbohydrate ABC transporter permease [Nonomuraea sp. NPDC050536]|uniref:carbohydrate ABC transporter permease n=1 Tax=Nonomuraea sp. NPDC050536 TaxID=3364366 RepID=UPI0037C965D0
MTAVQTRPAAVAVPVAKKARWRLPFSPWHLLLMPTALVFVLPLVWMVLTSLMSPGQIQRYPPPFLPDGIHLDGYARLFSDQPVLTWVRNSLVVVGCALAGQLVLCSLAGYGFARLRFPGRGVSFMLLLGTIMIPVQLLMIPAFIMFSRVGIANTLGAAIVPWLCSVFGIFMMRQFFLSLPAELEEAAMIDGCGRVRAFVRVVLPLARPALATLAVFALLGSWNDLIWPLIGINNPAWYTLQLGIAQFSGTHRTDWSLLMAGNVVATLPMALGFLFAQRHFVATMSFSAIKG